MSDLVKYLMTRSIARDARDGLSAADELRVFISSQKSDESGVRRDQARRHGFRAGGARKIWRALSLFFDDYGAL